MASTGEPTDKASTTSLPTTTDFDIDNITEHVIRICSQGQDARKKFIFERLVTHVHNFARETRLTTEEWRDGLDWLEACGKICVGNRKEFITVSDIFGLSTIVDEINHPKPPGVTQGSILGPFHSPGAEEKTNGDRISHDPNGEPLFVLCTIKDTNGHPVAGARVHVWEADSNGEYDIEKESSHTRPDGRGILRSNSKGEFYFDAIIPVPYPALIDGPVGEFLRVSGRHNYRPAHMHFMFEKEGFDKLITALYLRTSEYIDSDVAFGVKNSLLVDIQEMDGETAEKYNRSGISRILRYDFVLASDAETSALKEQNTIAAFKALGREQ